MPSTANTISATASLCPPNLATPPIKLPDYIYGHIGATYTYNALSFDLRFHGTTLSRQSCFLITGTGSPAGSNGCQPTIVGTVSWNGALSELKSALGAGK